MTIVVKQGTQIKGGRERIGDADHGLDSPTAPRDWNGGNPNAMCARTAAGGRSL
jgi:hypothetical protein